MGNAGKVVERTRARQLRGESWTLQEIADELDVAKGTVSKWVRGVAFEPRPRNRGAASHRPHPAKLARLREIESTQRDGAARFVDLSEQEFFAAGVMLYIGEGAKTAGTVSLANTDARVVAFFCAWLRSFFELDEERWRGSLHVHAGLDVEQAEAFWAEVARIPVARFYKTQIVPDSAKRMTSKHDMGCFTPKYSDVHIHRKVIGFCEGLLSSSLPDPG